MKKSLFIMALGTIALTSCSQDEVLEVKQDAIAFSAITENASRATASTAGTLTDFVVYANENGTGTAYIQGVVADDDNSLPGAGTWKLESTYYWPVANLDFYCISPATITGGTITPTNNIPSVVNYTVGSTHSEDLLYSVSLNTEKTETGIAQINFRHALAMVDFKVKTLKDYALDVKVEDIKIMNVSQTATYTLTSCTEGTNNNIPTSSTADVVAAKRGAWSALDAADEEYAFNVTDLTLDIEEDATQDLVKDVDGGPYFVLPQILSADDDLSYPVTGKSMFAINCVVSRKGVTIYDNYVYIPVSGTWKEGYKYTYTFIFGQGAGYKDDLVTPVIVPISFNLTVDELIADPQDVSMVAPAVVNP